MSDFKIGTQQSSYVQEIQTADSDNDTKVASNPHLKEASKAADEISVNCQSPNTEKPLTNKNPNYIFPYNKELDETTHDSVTSYLSKGYEAHKAGYKTDNSKFLNNLIKSTADNTFAKAKLDKGINEIITQLKDDNLSILKSDKLANAKYNLDAFKVIAQGADYATKTACLTNAIAYLSTLMATTTMSESNVICAKFMESALTYLAANEDMKAAEPFEKNLQEAVNQFEKLAAQSNDDHNIGVAALLSKFTTDLISQRDNTAQVYSQTTFHHDLKNASLNASLCSVDNLFSWDNKTESIVCKNKNCFDSWASISVDRKKANAIHNQINAFEKEVKNLNKLISSNDFYAAHKLIYTNYIKCKDLGNAMHEAYDNALQKHAHNILNKYIVINGKEFDSLNIKHLSPNEIAQLSDKIQDFISQPKKIQEFYSQEFPNFFSNKFPDNSNAYKDLVPSFLNAFKQMCIRSDIDISVPVYPSFNQNSELRFNLSNLDYLSIQTQYINETSTIVSDKSNDEVLESIIENTKGSYELFRYSYTVDNQQKLYSFYDKVLKDALSVK